MTDDQLNQTLSRIANHIEALSQGMDRFEAHLERVEDAQAEDRRRAIEERRRQDEAQLQADARLTRLENMTMMLLRAVRRERTDLRARIAALVEAQQRHETASAEKFQSLAESQRRLEEAMAEMARAITKTNQRIDASSGNGHPEG